MIKIKNKNLLIIGTGGHSKVIIDSAKLNGFNIIKTIDVKADKPEITKRILQTIKRSNEIKNLKAKNTFFFICIGDNKIRKEYYNVFKKIGFINTNIIHPSSIISSKSKIAKGTFVNAGAIINSEVTIGENTIINTGAVVDHEVEIGKHSHICPNVSLAGRVKIGNGVFIGIGSVIIEGISIKDNVIIGANSTIIKNVNKNLKIVGSPGRIIK